MKKSQLRKIIQEEIKNLKEGFFSSSKQPLTREDYFKIEDIDLNRTIEEPSSSQASQEKMFDLYSPVDDKIIYAIRDMSEVLGKKYKKNPNMGSGDRRKIIDELVDLTYDNGQVTYGEILDKVLTLYVK